MERSRAGRTAEREISGLGGDQRRHHVVDVILELVAVHVALAELQVQLKETHVGGIGQPGAVLRQNDETYLKG